MTEPRRVRTQVERDADGVAWRRAADTRPGYATWPQTASGSPSWWERPAPALRATEPTEPGPAGGAGSTDTAPTFLGRLVVGVNPDDPELSCIAHRFADEFAPFLAEQLRDPEVKAAYELEIAQPRRRWWHRLTRRAL